MYSKNLSATNFIVLQSNFFLMIGSLEVTHELIFTIPSVIQICSINSIRLRFNLEKPQIFRYQFCSRGITNTENIKMEM